MSTVSTLIYFAVHNAGSGPAKETTIYRSQLISLKHMKML